MKMSEESFLVKVPDSEQHTIVKFHIPRISVQSMHFHVTVALKSTCMLGLGLPQHCHYSYCTCHLDGGSSLWNAVHNYVRENQAEDNIDHHHAFINSSKFILYKCHIHVHVYVKNKGPVNHACKH